MYKALTGVLAYHLGRTFTVMRYDWGFHRPSALVQRTLRVYFPGLRLEKTIKSDDVPSLTHSELNPSRRYDNSHRWE